MAAGVFPVTKEPMMTDVACFCGCLYSFDGGAGACPGCGEYATVRTGPALGCTEVGQPRQLRVVGVCQNRHNGQAAGSLGPGDWVLVSDLLDRVTAAGALAGNPQAG
jgi:hypothetical protein